MTQPRIALDLDGVCYEWDKTARYMLRRWYFQRGRTIPPALYRPSPHWNALEEIVVPQAWDWLWRDGVRAGLFRYGHCVTGAIEGIQRLSHHEREPEIHFVTARPREVYRDTADWLALMFDAVPHHLHFLRDKSRFVADIYVDDSADNILTLHRRHPRAQLYLFRRLWSGSLETPPSDSIVVVTGWDSLVAHLLVYLDVFDIDG
jgi:5'(3')-deoxyribonucleotidase